MKEVHDFIQSAIREIVSANQNEQDKQEAEVVLNLEMNAKILDVPLDSIQYIMLIVMIEEKYGFEFEDDYLMGDDLCLADICEYICANQV